MARERGPTMPWSDADDALLCFTSFVTLPAGATPQLRFTQNAERLAVPLLAARSPEAVRTRFNAFSRPHPDERPSRVMDFGGGAVWEGNGGEGDPVECTATAAALGSAFVALGSVCKLLRDIATQRPSWVRGLVASWPSTSTGLRLLAARAYPLFFSLYAAGRADVLEAVAFRLRDILRQPIDPTGAHSIREAADALPLPGTAAAPVTLAQVRANGFGWAADWIAAGRMPVTPSIVPRTLDDLFPGGAAEAGRRVAAPSADDSLPVPEMPDVFGAGTVLPWELVRGFPDTLVYDLHATTVVKLPLQAVLPGAAPTAHEDLRGTPVHGRGRRFHRRERPAPPVETAPPVRTGLDGVATRPLEGAVWVGIRGIW